MLVMEAFLEWVGVSSAAEVTDTCRDSVMLPIELTLPATLQTQCQVRGDD